MNHSSCDKRSKNPNCCHLFKKLSLPLLPISIFELFLEFSKTLKTRKQKGTAMAAQSKVAAPPRSSLASGGASSLLSDLPSRGLFSSTVLSSSLGGMRVYVCDHDTSPPEEQVIKTNTTNILIRALQINKQKTDLKEATKPNKGKRSAGRALEERTPAKKANTASSSSGARHEGSSATEFSEKKLQSMTVERLRLQLRERGLSPKGKKDELISRLRDAS